MPYRDAVMMLAGPQPAHRAADGAHGRWPRCPGCLTPELIVRQGARDRRRRCARFRHRRPASPLPGSTRTPAKKAGWGTRKRGHRPCHRALQAEGIDVTGPHPADALFTPRARHDL
jgi:4-hydroxythreonine-4-phosphate dehydrogenase